MDKEDLEQLSIYFSSLFKSENSLIAFDLYRKAKEMYETLSFVGVTIEFSDAIEARVSEISVEYNLDSLMSRKHLVLEYAINAVNNFPSYLPILLFYPRAFEARYVWAKFRLLVIEEYEKAISKIENFDFDGHRQLICDFYYSDELKTLNFIKNQGNDPRRFLGGTPNPQNDIFSIYKGLFSLYIKEYSFEKASELVNKTEFVGQPDLYSLVAELARKSNKIDEGISRLLEIKKYHDSNPSDFPVQILQNVIHGLEKEKKKKPFVPRRRKKEKLGDEYIFKAEF